MSDAGTKTSTKATDSMPQETDLKEQNPRSLHALFGELAETWKRRLWEYDNDPKKGDDPAHADQLAKCFLALVAVMESSPNKK